MLTKTYACSVFGPTVDNLLTPDEHLGTQLVCNLYDEYCWYHLIGSGGSHCVWSYYSCHYMHKTES